jgi:hypothetical protein
MQPPQTSSKKQRANENKDGGAPTKHVEHPPEPSGGENAKIRAVVHDDVRVWPFNSKPRHGCVQRMGQGRTQTQQFDANPTKPVEQHNM